jgi:DNA-directed RNA polymerase subunit H (RpoH/RPB5)
MKSIASQMLVSLYDRFKMINVFCQPQYRNYTMDKETDNMFASLDISLEDFSTRIISDDFIAVKGASVDGSKVTIILFPKDSNFTKQSALFVKLTRQIKSGGVLDGKIITISENGLSTYIRKSLNTLRPFIFEPRLTRHFIIEGDKGPGCSKIRVMPKDETVKIFRDFLRCNHLRQAKIFLSDPQIIWSGAQLGQVVEITSKSGLSGERISYRIVYPEKFH